MSGFERDIIIKFDEKENVKLDEIIKLFSICLQVFFKTEAIKPVVDFSFDFVSIYFFISNRDISFSYAGDKIASDDTSDEKLYSFLLSNYNFPDNSTKYLSIIDNSRDTTELLSDRIFFDFIVTCLNSHHRILDAYLLFDCDYFSINEVFDNEKYFKSGECVHFEKYYNNKD